MSIRRWIPGSSKKDRVPFLKENINAHIKVGETKYCQVQIEYNHAAAKVDWKEQDKECYNIWGYQQLPSAEDVLMDPEADTVRILLPYKNGMPGMEKSKIGTGVPVLDKACLYRSIFGLLRECNVVCEQPEANRVSMKGQKFRAFITRKNITALKNSANG